MRSGSRSLKTIVMNNDRIFRAEGREFFALEDGLVYWYDTNVELKMVIPTHNIKYMFRGDYNLSD